MLVRGFDTTEYAKMPSELNDKTFGIIGLGAVGRQVARIALGFNLNVIYYSRTRNQELENKGLVYQDLDSLLQTSDFISLHVPRNLRILNKREFDLIKPGSVLINTAIGDVFNIEDFKDWIKKGHNFAIIDNQSYIDQLQDLPRCIALPIGAGKTKESIDRLGNKVIENIKSYLSS